MLGELIGEFRGKNTGYRILPDGKIENSGQGTGKILGTDAAIMFTAVSVAMPDGTFVGEGNGVITTMEGEIAHLKTTSVAWATAKGGTTRSASTQTTTSQKLARLNKVLLIHEYDTTMDDTWVGKIWEWK
jgi:hypothetical protein